MSIFNLERKKMKVKKKNVNVIVKCLLSPKNIHKSKVYDFFNKQLVNMTNSNSCKHWNKIIDNVYFKLIAMGISSSSYDPTFPSKCYTVNYKLKAKNKKNWFRWCSCFWPIFNEKYVFTSTNIIKVNLLSIS